MRLMSLLQLTINRYAVQLRLTYVLVFTRGHLITTLILVLSGYLRFYLCTRNYYNLVILLQVTVHSVLGFFSRQCNCKSFARIFGGFGRMALERSD